MAQEDDEASVPTGCCVIDDPNAPGGKTKIGPMTEKACRDVAGSYGLTYKFYPNTSCSSVG